MSLSLQIANEEQKEKKSHQVGKYFRINYSKLNNYQAITDFLSLFAKRYNISYANLCWYCCNKGFENVIDKLQKHYENDKETERPKQSRSIIQSLKSSTQSFFDRFKNVDSLLDALKKGKISANDVSNHITKCRIITVGIDNTPSLARYNHLIDSKRDTKKVDTCIPRYTEKIKDALLNKEDIQSVSNTSFVIPKGYTIPSYTSQIEEKEEDKEKEPAELFFSHDYTSEQMDVIKQEEKEYQDEKSLVKSKLFETALLNDTKEDDEYFEKALNNLVPHPTELPKDERSESEKQQQNSELASLILEEEYNTCSGN